jgi:hypothetical protein
MLALGQSHRWRATIFRPPPIPSLTTDTYRHTSSPWRTTITDQFPELVFADQVVAGAMIDRIVHHADVIALKGASYRLKNHQASTHTTTTTE